MQDPLEQLYNEFKDSVDESVILDIFYNKANMDIDLAK